MVAKHITHAELDERLSSAARNLETYETEVRRLIDELDAQRRPLEIVEETAWRKDRVKTDRRVGSSLEDHFRSEIEGIEILARVPEARLARRVEFARWRAEKAMAAAGLDAALLAVGPEHGAGPIDERRHRCAWPKDACRRWRELHALRTEMVERNLYLVLINVERYSHTRASRMDLVQEGAAALFRAVDGFDWRRGLLFRTYAVHWLNQAFRSYLYNFGNTVRVPVYLQKAMKHVHDAIERIGDSNAPLERIAEESGLGENLVTAALEATRSTHSIDAVYGSEDDGTSLRDLISSDEDAEPYDPRMEEVTLHHGVEMALDRLSERERHVITMRFGLGETREHTLAELAGDLGVSLERVRQIQVQGLKKMQRYVEVRVVG